MPVVFSTNFVAGSWVLTAWQGGKFMAQTYLPVPDEGPNRPLIFISSKGLEGAVEKVMFEFSWTSSIVSYQYDLDEVIFKYTLIPAHSSSHQLNEIYEVICIPHKATPSPCVRFSLMKVLGDPLYRRRSCGNINKRCGSPVLRLHGRACIEWQCFRGKKWGGLLDHT